MLPDTYLDTLSDPILALYEEYQQRVINDIARRLVKSGRVTDTAAWQLQRLTESGKVYETALEELAALTGQSEAVLRATFEKAGVKALRFDDAIYKAAGLNPLPLNLSPAMAQALAAGLQKTRGVMQNLTMTTALSSQQAYIHAADVAYVQITSGAFDYQSALKTAIKGAASEGLQVIYPSGRHDQLDVALRRTILTGVNQTVGKLQERRMQDMGTDLVQTSAHIGARPSHAVWQGQIFSMSGTHAQYPKFSESTGYGTGPGLMGWNCRHSWFPFFEGISENAYRQSELDSFADKTVTYQGDKLSVYDATQEQRAIERQIRQWKRQASALEAAGIDNTAELGKVRHYQAKMRDFTRQTGLQRQRGREQVWTGGAVTKVERAISPITPVQPKTYAEKLIEERYSDIPTDPRLRDLHQNATDRLKRIDAARNTSDVRDVYKYAESAQLAHLERTFGIQVQDLKKKRRESTLGGAWGAGDEEIFQNKTKRLTEIKTEVQHRREWYDTSRQLEAIRESNRTGMIVLERGDVSELLGQARDVYMDNGWRPDQGKPPFQPELFKTSDLSGAKIRHYITLPDGRIAHPDEIHEARTRGRIIVIDEIKTPTRDWTQRPAEPGPIEIKPTVIKPVEDKPADPFERFVDENRRSLERAQAITPQMLDVGAGKDDDLTNYIYNFFAYDDDGTPIFSKTLLNDTKNDLFYNIWSLGKGHMTVDRMYPIREKAAALLSGHVQSGGEVFSLKERLLLERMASADDDIALAAIDELRDRRLKGALAQKRYGGSGRRVRSEPGFVSAQTADAKAYLQEYRLPGWRQ